MTSKERYKANKEILRQMAINYLLEPQKNQSWEDVARITEYFYTMGKKYGLVKEFRENGII